MTTALLFSAADKLRSFKNEAEVIDVLLQETAGELHERIAEWKSMDFDAIRESLKDRLLDDLKATLPDRLQFLLEPVSSLDDHLVDLGEWSKEDATTFAPVKVTASLTGSVELDGVLDEDLGNVLQGPVPAGAALFTISVNGKIGIDASGSAATPLVSLSVTAGGSGSQTLTVGFVRDADQPVLLELLRIRDYFVNPADLDSVMESFSDKTSRLIQHHYQGTHSIGLKIAVERDLAGALRELIGDPALSPEGEAEMSLSVSFKNGDDFLLTIERDSASSAFVHLERKSAQERSQVFKLGTSIGIKGLKDQIVNRIGELLPDSPKVKDALAKLDELVDKVDEDGLRELVRTGLANRFPDHASLFETLLDNTPVEDVKDRILDELTDALTDRVNERVDLLSDEASAAASSVSQDVATALALDANSAVELHDFLAASLTSAISSLQEKLAAKIKNLNSSASDELRTILEPFADVTETVDDAIDNLGRKTASALDKVKAGIEEVYSKYTNFRQKLTELVSERVTEQVAFSFINDATETKTDATLISFRIVDARADGVADLYRAIWSRRLDDAWDLMQKAQADAGIKDLEGSYVSALKNQQRAVLSLNLFGVTIGTSVIFSDEVSVGVDHTGKLVVAKTKAELDVKRHLGSESQTLSVEWSFDFLDADPSVVPPIKISIEVGDKKFDKDDLRAFFASLNKLDCVKPDAFDAVGMQLLGGVNSTKRLTDVTLGLIVALTWNDLGAILGANRDGSPRTDKWNGADVAAQLFAAVKRGHRDADFFAELEKTATLEGREPLALLLELGTTSPTTINQDHPRLIKYGAIGRSMILLGRHLETLQTKWLALLTDLRAPGGPATVDRRQQMIADIDKELRSVLVALFLNNTFAAFPDLSEVWQAAAGARVLLDRAKRDHLLLTMDGPMIAWRIVA